MTRVAVLDIGKTNAKVALVDRDTLTEIAVVTTPNRVRPGPPWPHFDLSALWAFLLQHLGDFHRRFGVQAISVTTHGASGVLLAADGGLAAPMLDYEHPGPNTLAAQYDALRPDFALTGSPRLPMGLNLGAQLHWQFATDPGLSARVAQVVTYPGYWGHRLTGRAACDLSSLGCHTDLWEPFAARPSALVEALGLSGRLAPARRPDEVLGTLLPGVAAATGLPQGTPVTVGIHDSNASLLPHLSGRVGPFAVVSTGTWVIAMAIGGAARPLDPARDVLVNVNALGQPVPSARFMGGRELARICGAAPAPPTEADRRGALASGLLMLPAVEGTSGPFPGRPGGWTHPPATPGQAAAAMSWYLALMTRTCLDLAGAKGPVVVEGPLARNPDLIAMLAAITPEGVELAASETGTAEGAALFVPGPFPPAATTPAPVPPDLAALRSHAAAWRARVSA